MLYIIKNYKQLYLNCIKSEFSGPESNNSTEELNINPDLSALERKMDKGDKLSDNEIVIYEKYKEEQNELHTIIKLELFGLKNQMPDHLVEDITDEVLINWNKNKFTKEGIKVIQGKLGITADDIFGPNTLAKIKEIATDGKIGLNTLIELKLVNEKTKVASPELSEDMFKNRIGNLSQIIFHGEE